VTEVPLAVRRLNPLLSEAGFSTSVELKASNLAIGSLNPLLSEAGFSTIFNKVDGNAAQFERLNPLLSEAGFSTCCCNQARRTRGSLNPLLSEAGFSTFFGQVHLVVLP